LSTSDTIYQISIISINRFIIILPILGNNYKDSTETIRRSERGDCMDKHNFYKNILDNLYDGVYITDFQRKIIYWNTGAEKITGYKKEEIVNRGCWEDILVHVDDNGANLCTGSCPLQATIQDGKSREAEVFLKHKEGHRIPVLIRTTPLYNDEGIITGGIEVFSDNSPRISMKQQIDELHKLAMFDPLTELANRRYLEMRMNSQLSEFQRYDWSFGIVFIDVDNFKMFNDQYGHEIGDAVLKMVARTLFETSRPYDLVGRYGGEEFIALVVNVSPEQLKRVAERYRSLVEKSSLYLNENRLSITISAGYTQAQKHDTIYTLLRRADMNLFRCKNNGKNCAYGDEDSKIISSV
jgi:diguanylate cyclase (GGDEF)-like protein/PAS domain S-box-containing protein